MFLFRFINTDEECMHKNQTEIINLKSRKAWIYYINTVKPLITNTSIEFIKCRLENFTIYLTILYYVKFSICENSHEYAGTVLKSSIQSFN